MIAGIDRPIPAFGGGREYQAAAQSGIGPQDDGMTVSLRHLLGWIVSAFSSREDLILENLALRQQLLTLHATPDLAVDSPRCTSCSGSR